MGEYNESLVGSTKGGGLLNGPTTTTADRECH